MTAAAGTLPPVLMIGGYGSVGGHAARALRKLHPDVEIAVAGRHPEKAEALVREIGNAHALMIDLARPDLGLPPDAAFGAVAVFMKDTRLQSLNFALGRAIPYVSISDYAFEIGPAVALQCRGPARSAVLLLGHHLGGVVTLAALHFAGEYRAIDAMEIGAVFDDADLGGATAQADTRRVAHAAPHPLVLADGEWVWADEDRSARRFADGRGVLLDGYGYSLLDVPSLAASTGARQVRFDAAVRGAGAGDEAGDGRPRHEVVIEIVGERNDGTAGRFRYEIADDEVHARMSGQGVALAIERLVGLAGGEPAAPGLHLPENLLDPAYVVERMVAFGARIRRVA